MTINSARALSISRRSDYSARDAFHGVETVGFERTTTAVLGKDARDALRGRGSGQRDLESSQLADAAENLSGPFPRRGPPDQVRREGIRRPGHLPDRRLHRFLRRLFRP